MNMCYFNKPISSYIHEAEQFNNLLTSWIGSFNELLKNPIKLQIFQFSLADDLVP